MGQQRGGRTLAEGVSETTMCTEQLRAWEAGRESAEHKVKRWRGEASVDEQVGQHGEIYRRG